MFSKKSFLVNPGMIMIHHSLCLAFFAIILRGIYVRTQKGSCTFWLWWFSRSVAQTLCPWDSPGKWVAISFYRYIQRSIISCLNLELPHSFRMSSQTHKIRDLAQSQVLLNKGKGLDKEAICDMEAR